MFFNGLDSFQMLLLQDSTEKDKYFVKLKIIGEASRYKTSLGKLSSTGFDHSLQNLMLMGVDPGGARGPCHPQKFSLVAAVYLLFFIISEYQIDILCFYVSFTFYLPVVRKFFSGIFKNKPVSH